MYDDTWFIQVWCAYGSMGWRSSESARAQIVHALAEKLNQDRQAGHFDERIIAIAPGQAATLQYALDAATSAHIVEVLAKDLTKTTASDI